ncbi:MAG: MFS transporter [Syntrophobacteraceae bacterium]
MRKFNFRALLLLSCGHVAVDTFQGALPAVLPFLKDSLSLSYTMTGIILIVANISSSVIQPVFGRLADRKNTFTLLPLGALLAGTGFCALPLAPNYALVVLLAAVSGTGISIFHPAAFKTARFFTGEKMATGMAIFSVGGNAGMALGPILAVSLIHYKGFGSLWWMAAVTLLFLALLLLFGRTLATPCQQSQPAATGAASSPRTAHRALSVIICIMVLRTWTMYCMMTYIPFYYINYLRGNPIFAGKLVSLFLVGGAAGTLIGSPLADRFGHRFWLGFSLFCDALLFPLILRARGPALFGLVMLFGLMLVSTFPVTIVMGQNLFPRNTGVASGFMSGFAIGAGGIGVTILGFFADHFGVPMAMKCIGALPVAAFLLTLLLRYPVLEKSVSAELRAN